MLSNTQKLFVASSMVSLLFACGKNDVHQKDSQLLITNGNEIAQSDEPSVVLLVFGPFSYLYRYFYQ